VPLSVAILVGLFTVQRYGTGTVGWLLHERDDGALALDVADSTVATARREIRGSEGRLARVGYRRRSGLRP